MMRATAGQEIPRGLHIPKCFKHHRFFKDFLKVTKEGAAERPGRGRVHAGSAGGRGCLLIRNRDGDALSAEGAIGEMAMHEQKQE